MVSFVKYGHFLECGYYAMLNYDLYYFDAVRVWNRCSKVFWTITCFMIVWMVTGALASSTAVGGPHDPGYRGGMMDPVYISFLQVARRIPDRVMH